MIKIKLTKIINNYNLKTKRNKEIKRTLRRCVNNSSKYS